jgi:calcium-independent phospholipase A2-gamma
MLYNERYKMLKEHTSIIALMLGRLRMTIDECIIEYAELGEFVFSDRQGVPHRNMFKASKLEQAVKKVIRRQLGEQRADESLIDPLGSESCCKV